MVKYFDVEIKKFEEMELISLRSNPYTLETNFRFRIGIEIYVDSIVKITFAFREFRLILKYPLMYKTINMLLLTKENY